MALPLTAEIVHEGSAWLRGASEGGASMNSKNATGTQSFSFDVQASSGSLSLSHIHSICKHPMPA